MVKVEEHFGEKYHRLTVVGYDHEKKKYRFKCECGSEKTITSSLARVKDGRVKSCGCWHRQESSERMTQRNTTHGSSGSRLYGIWSDMRKRCENPSHWAFDRYGGRGIKVCKDWSEYWPFRTWAMSHGYRDDLTIDRIDVNGNYEPCNCRWATMKEQANNKSNNRKYLFESEMRTLSEIARMVGIKEPTLRGRISRGWDIDKAVNTPIGNNGRG